MTRKPLPPELIAPLYREALTDLADKLNEFEDGKNYEAYASEWQTEPRKRPRFRIWPVVFLALAAWVVWGVIVVAFIRLR